MNARTARLGRPKDEAKRAAIFDAAQALFLKRGLQGTSMDAIAAAAGVSKLTVYSHFADKDALFKAVIADKCASLSPLESFQKLAESGPAPCLAQIAEGFTDLMAHPDVIAMHRVVTSEAARNPRIAQLLYEAGPERYKSAFVALLQNFHNRGQLQVPDPELACEQFFHMLKGEYHQRLLLNLKPKATREERLNYARACVGVFLRAYGGNTEGGSGTGGGQEPCR
jgi:TetR/AcrR family transcriptional repressor of mexJK operon